MMRKIFAVVMAVAMAATIFFAAGTCTAQDNIFTVTGTVRYINLEGGFWGIVGDDGRHYDPINLSKELQKEGLRAEFKLKVAENQIGFHMWGLMVEILGYRIIEQPGP